MNYKSILDGFPCPNPLCSDGSVKVASELDCGLCEGEGKVTQGYMDLEGLVECWQCDGTGTVTIESWDTCLECGGAGVLEGLAVPVSENQMRLI